MSLRRGIGVEGVASEIGAIGDDNFVVLESSLIDGLCYRFGVSVDDARFAISRALQVGAINRRGEYIELSKPEEGW